MLVEIEAMETEDNWLMESRLEIKAAMRRLLWGEAKCKRVASAALKSIASNGFNPIRPEHHIGAFLTVLATDGFLTTDVERLAQPKRRAS